MAPASRLPTTLLVPFKPDEERDRVASAWAATFGEVLRLDRFWEPPDLDPSELALYGNHTFCHVLAQKLGLELVSPPGDLLVRADPKWTGRALGISTLEECLRGPFPNFVKPLVPKLFRASVWPDPAADLDELNRSIVGLIEVIAEYHGTSSP